MLFRYFYLSIILICPVFAGADEFRLGDLTIDHAWARESPPTVTNGAAYMTITNAGVPVDRLLGAQAGVSDRVELHTHLMDEGMMRMRQVDSIGLESGTSTQLGPGGHHIMFIGLRAPLKAGDHIPLTLRFERAGDIEIQVPVKTMDEAAAMMHRHGESSPGHDGASSE
jgi:copper(I)-binding protein